MCAHCSYGAHMAPPPALSAVPCRNFFSVEQETTDKQTITISSKAQVYMQARPVHCDRNACRTPSSVAWRAAAWGPASKIVVLQGRAHAVPAGWTRWQVAAALDNRGRRCTQAHMAAGMHRSRGRHRKPISQGLNPGCCWQAAAGLRAARRSHGNRPGPHIRRQRAAAGSQPHGPGACLSSPVQACPVQPALGSARFARIPRSPLNSLNGQPGRRRAGDPCALPVIRCWHKTTLTQVHWPCLCVWLRPSSSCRPPSTPSSPSTAPTT